MFRIVSLFIVFIYILPFTIFLDSKYLFEYLQVIMILFSFFLGASCVKKKVGFVPVDYQFFFVANEKILQAVFLLYFILNFTLYVDIVQHLFIYQDFGQWLLENTVARYAGESDVGPIKKISTILFIIYMVLLGAYNHKAKWKLYYFILFLLLLAETSALSRATVLMGFVAYFVEILIRNNYFFTTIKNAKIIKIGLCIFIVLAVVFFFSAYFRVQNDDNVSDILIRKVGEYLISHYEALYIWMHQSQEYAKTWGFSSFTGIYKIFTSVKVQDGFYAGVQTQYGSTVIYTTLRGLLDDFGYTLTVVLFFLSGLYLKYFTYVRMNGGSYIFVRTIMFLILYMFYSPFLFATVLIGYILAYFLLFIPKIK